MAGGLLVGPATGFVGALVRASVTTKLWPSHPLVDNRSAYRSVSQTLDLGTLEAPTISAPRFVFILDDDLSQSGGEPMAVIVDHGLSDVLRCLAHQVFQFLPAAVRGDLRPIRTGLCRGLGEGKTHSLKKHDEFIVRPARSRTASFVSA